MVQEEKPILVQKGNKPMLHFDKTRVKEDFLKEESSPKAPNLESTSLDHHIKEIIEV